MEEATRAGGGEGASSPGAGKPGTRAPRRVSPPQAFRLIFRTAATPPLLQSSGGAVSIHDANALRRAPCRPTAAASNAALASTSTSTSTTATTPPPPSPPASPKAHRRWRRTISASHPASGAGSCSVPPTSARPGHRTVPPSSATQSRACAQSPGLPRVAVPPLALLRLRVASSLTLYVASYGTPCSSVA